MIDKISRRTASAADGLAWLSESFSLVFKAPLAIIGIFFAWFVVVCILNFIPILGGIVSQILNPILMAGVYAFCRQFDKKDSGSIVFNLLLSPFQDKSKLTQLALLGAINIIFFAGLLVISGFLIGALYLAASAAPAQLFGLPTLWIAILCVLLIITVTALFAACNWLAVPLIMFANLKVMDALKESLMACFDNIISTLVFGGAAVLILIVSIVPFGLGLIVTIPALFVSSYVAYKSIYLSENIIEQT